MARKRAWTTYPETYRAKEMETLVKWVAAGESCSVVGLAGCGRSNLLGFLCRRPDVLPRYLPPDSDSVVLIPVELYNLPGNDLSNLYRTILHAFYWVRDRFDPALQQIAVDLYLENRAIQDPFLPQRALYDLLLAFQKRQIQVVLVFNRFDHFCRTATPQMINTLRGLRDTFKDTLCFVVGMLQDVVYLPDPAVLGDMYELLDSHVCWVGAMSESDARYMLDTLIHPAEAPPTEAEVETMLRLSGRFPVLLKAVIHWRLTTAQRPALEEWSAALLEESGLHYRLERMWDGLTQEEQQALSKVQKLQSQVMAPDGRLPENMPKSKAKEFQSLARRQRYALNRLAAKGLCYQEGAGWWLRGGLLAAYVAGVEGRVRGRIWLDKQTGIIYQGQQPLDNLTALESAILRFLIANLYAKLTREDIIDNAWPDEDRREGITTNALHVHIASLRKKLESNPAKPRYLITWRGRPGGYQFFPEGKPAT